MAAVRDLTRTATGELGYFELPELKALEKLFQPDCWASAWRAAIPRCVLYKLA